MPKQMKKFQTVIKVLLIVMPIVGVIAYNNLSTAIILLGIAVVMSFVASPKYAQFFALGGLGIAFGSIFIYLERYRAERIKIWLNPEDYEKGYQTLQGLYAIGCWRSTRRRAWRWRSGWTPCPARRTGRAGRRPWAAWPGWWNSAAPPRG